MLTSLPTEHITFVQQFINLTPVLVGGLVGLAGSVVAAHFSHKLQRVDKVRQTQIEHLEQVLSLSYETLNWARKDAYSITFGIEFVEESPEYKLRALSSLYFPSLNKLVFDFTIACSACFMRGERVQCPDSLVQITFLIKKR